MEATKPLSFKAAVMKDAASEIYPPTKVTLMEKLDAKTTQKTTLTNGTIWLVGTCLVLAMVLFNYVGSIIGWTRSDEANRQQTTVLQNDVKEMREQMNKLESQFAEIQKALTAQAIRDAENKGKALGYDVGRTDAKTGH
jgi:uncharacterized protein HemX